MSGFDGYVWYRWAFAILGRTDVRPSTKLVANAFPHHARNETGEFWVKDVTLAAECGLKVTVDKDGKERSRAVQTAREELQLIQVLIVTHPGVGRSPTRYRLLPFHIDEGRADERPSGARTCAPAAHGRAPQPRTSERPRGAQTSAQNYSGELPGLTPAPNYPNELTTSTTDLRTVDASVRSNGLVVGVGGHVVIEDEDHDGLERPPRRRR